MLFDVVLGNFVFRLVVISLLKPETGWSLHDPFLFLFVKLTTEDGVVVLLWRWLEKAAP